MPMRLDRFLSGQTTLSRKEAGERIRRGAVTVGGVTVRKPDTAVSPETDSIMLDGSPVTYQQYRDFLMHKPQGVITASRDTRQETVLDLLAPADRVKGLFPAGRLDIDTSGLLLLTTDGQLAHQMLSPKHHAQKFYLAQLRDPFHAEYKAAFAAGMTLREGAGEITCLPAQCECIAERLAVLEIGEGKYHQVKRMFAAMGNHVEQLLRVGIGGLLLPPDLPAGGYLQILHKDAELVLKKTHISDVCAFCAENYSSYWINAEG